MPRYMSVVRGILIIISVCTNTAMTDNDEGNVGEVNVYLPPAAPPSLRILNTFTALPYHDGYGEPITGIG